jgi:hypothetical protein
VRCSQCGSDASGLVEDGAAIDRTVASVGKTYQVVVACANCGTAFVVLARN